MTVGNAPQTSEDLNYDAIGEALTEEELKQLWESIPYSLSEDKKLCMRHSMIKHSTLRRVV